MRKRERKSGRRQRSKPKETRRRRYDNRVGEGEDEGGVRGDREERREEGEGEGSQWRGRGYSR